MNNKKRARGDKDSIDLDCNPPESKREKSARLAKLEAELDEMMPKFNAKEIHDKLKAELDELAAQFNAKKCKMEHTTKGKVDCFICYSCDELIVCSPVTLETEPDALFEYFCQDCVQTCEGCDAEYAPSMQWWHDEHCSSSSQEDEDGSEDEMDDNGQKIT